MDHPRARISAERPCKTYLIIALLLSILWILLCADGLARKKWRILQIFLAYYQPDKAEEDKQQAK